jgi:hypothetical protein
MHNPANKFPRTLLLGSWVNKGIKKGRSPQSEDPGITSAPEATQAKGPSSERMSASEMMPTS